MEAVVANRNSPQKHVRRAWIALLTADGLGTVAIMRQTGKSKTAVWRWQERFGGGLRQARQAPPQARRLPLDRRLQAAINRFLDETNDNPRPFTWTADPTKSSPPSGVGTKR